VAGAWNGSNEPIHYVFDGPLPDHPSGGFVDFEPMSARMKRAAERLS
jgi:hypothetical protein